MLDKEFFLKPDELSVKKEEDFIAEIPSGLTNRQDLFKALQDNLKLPNYFGYNWDALAECLRDLSWIMQKRVIIIHHDIPVLAKKEIEEYMDILATGMRYWKNSEQHELLVFFP